MKKLSVILIARDEEQNIEDCLQSVNWADEIVVVIDSRSQDRTSELAQKFTDKVYKIEWRGYSNTKSFAVDKADGEWIFWIDADERVTPELREDIQEAISKNNDVDGYVIPRLANFLGRWIKHCGWYPGYVLRLFRRGSARFNDALVHEGLDFEGKLGKLSHPMLHYTDRDIKHYFLKYNDYTSLASEELARKGKQFKVVDLIFRPIFTFIKMYIFRLGFFDGIQGFMLSVFSANYVFTKYAKLWEWSRLQNHE